MLDYLFREGPAHRVDVIRATSLSRATVSKLIGELQAQGLVAERRTPLTVAGRSGRPPTLLALNPALGAFGGVDFGHSSVRVAIADVAGTLIAEDRQDLDVDNDAERAIAVAVDGLLGSAGTGRAYRASGCSVSARRSPRPSDATARAWSPPGSCRAGAPSPRSASSRAGSACRCTSATTPTSARWPRSGRALRAAPPTSSI